MFWFKRKTKLIDCGIFDGLVDHHSHILPGVDDGSPALAKSLDILAYYESLGVRRVVLTPHVMINKRGVVDPSEHEGVYTDLLANYKGNIELSLAAEYMLDGGYQSHMESGLRCVTTDAALVETSYVSSPNNMAELLYDTMSSGIRPVIAHPERYLYMEMHDYDLLKSNGCALQLNLLSLSGFYGQGVVKKAEYLLSNDMYDVLGSDIHSLSMFKRWIDTIKLTSKQVDSLMLLKSGRL